MTATTSYCDLSVTDALGRTVALDALPRRVVSLVPSLTEALFAFGLREEVAGITCYCVEPAELVRDVATVGGTKDPDLAAIRKMAPDLVIASAEENVREHVEALISDGLAVYVSLPGSVGRALEELRDLARLIGRGEDAAWLVEAERLAEAAEQRLAAPDASPVPYFCPIWRRPYMVAAPGTYMHDLLRLCGGHDIFADRPSQARYYPVELSDAMAHAPAVVLLPSEPYPFEEKHQAEFEAYADAPAVRDGCVHLVDGQLVTWYGPRIAQALTTLAPLLSRSIE